MKRTNDEGTIRTLDDEALTTASGGTVCTTLSQLRVAAETRGDDGMEAFFQGALNGAGCTSGSCHGTRRYSGQHS